MANKKITIGLFNDTFYPMIDGVITVVDNYAKRLSKYANVIVFVPVMPKQKFDDSTLPYKVVRSKAWKVPFMDYSLALIDRNFKKELANYNLDIVHIHSPFTVGSAGIKYAKKHNIPVIATMHSQFKQDIKRFVHFEYPARLINNKLIRVFNKCDECWAVNKEVARIFHEEYGYKTMPRVMNNATDMKLVKDYNKARERINKIHNLKKIDKVFLFVGRINKLKNIFFIADALIKLKSLKPKYNFKMLFIGNGQDEKEFKEYINKNKLVNEVIFCGRVTDRELLADYYARADLFLFPSLYDASSLVQIEAASQKTPTLFLEGSATSATITDKVDGLIIKNDTLEYAKTIDELMNNEKKYKELQDNAYKNLYVNWDTQVKKAYELYLEFINKKTK